MKAEIKGENLLVFCTTFKEQERFLENNRITCRWDGGAFEWKEYIGIRTYGDKTGKLVFWFKPEHLPELKFN